MSQKNTTTDSYLQIIEEYFQETGIPPFDVLIIESNDLESAFYTIRSDQMGKGWLNYDEYHGFCVPPAVIDGLFTILLKKDYMVHSKVSCKFDWVGTIVHEVTHVNDYQKYQQMVSSKTYDELFDQGVHRVFNFWTEYHARSMGEQYVMKYRKANNSPCAELEHIISEYQTLVNWYNGIEGPGERLLEGDATLLGKLRVWEKWFPETFNDKCLSDIESIQKLYCFLKDHDTLEKVAPHFQQLHDLLKGVHPCMP